MAGRGRYIYIKDEIDERLQKEDNKSQLINNLLKQYFDENDINQMNAKQLKAELAVRKIEREAKAKIKELRKDG